MPKYEVVLMSTGGAAFEVHAAGCKDLKSRRLLRQANGPACEVEAESGMAAGLDFANGDELGYTEQDIRVMPCCKGAQK